MIINRVELTGYNYQKVNSDYFFEPGLNMIIGDNASGKTTILNSIISGFSAETFQEHWSGYDTQFNLSENYPNQEPIITIEFQYQGATFCLSKKIKKDGIECQLYIINEQGTKSFVCEGVEAIERTKQYSNEIIYLTGEEIDSMRHHLGILNHDGQSLSEYQSMLNELLKKYGSGYWSDKMATVVDGQIVVFMLHKLSPEILAQGAISFLVLMSVVASVKMNKSSPILIIDDFWRSMDYSSIYRVRKCLSEVLDSQVILTSHSMHLSDLEVESNMIQLNR